MNWTIIDYRKDHPNALPNDLGRSFIACVIPWVTEYSQKGRVEYLRPALPGLAFIPCEERLVRIAIETARYVEDVWRLANGDLVSVPDAELQHFLDGLAKRERKPAREKKTMRLAEMAAAEWFALYARNFGPQAAVKRFGKDLRMEAA